MHFDDNICAHYLNLDFSEKFFSEEDIKVQVQLPYPIHKPFNNHKTDVIIKYNEDLEGKKQEFEVLRKEFRLKKSEILNQDVTGSHVTVTKGMVNYCNAELIELPFECDFNPFYTTGLLEIYSRKNRQFLLRPDLENYLNLTRIDKPHKTYKLNEKPFPEIITGISLCDNLMLTKHNKEINLIRILSYNNSEVLYTKHFKSHILDAKISRTRFGVVKTDTKLNLFDIEKQTKLNFNNLEDMTTKFHFIDEQNLAILSPTKLTILDVRSPNDYLTVEPKLNSCNTLTCMKIENHCIYLASRHHLMVSDMRSTENIEFCTHLMKNTPCFIDFKKDLLVLSSQKNNESVLFTGNPISSLPIEIPDIQETLYKCKLENNVSLKVGLNKRLSKSTGGAKIIEKNNETTLYTVNYQGELFAQEIGGNSKKNPVECLHNWIRDLPPEPTPLHLTDVVNLSNARFSLNKAPNQAYLKQFTRNSPKLDLFLGRFKNQYHKNNLGELAANFSSIWEDEDEEEPSEDVDLVPEVAPADKVTKWIESSVFD